MTCFVYVLQTIQKTICSKYNTGTKFAVYWYPESIKQKGARAEIRSVWAPSNIGVTALTTAQILSARSRRSRTSPFPSALPCSKRKTLPERSCLRGSMRSGVILAAIDFQKLVLRVALQVLPHRADLLAGAAAAVEHAAAIFCTAVNSEGKIFAAVFAGAHHDLFLNTLAQRKVDQVVHTLWIKHLGELLFTHKLKRNLHRLEVKFLQRRSLLIRLHPHRKVNIGNTCVQYRLKQAQDLLLHGRQIAWNVRQLLVRQQLRRIFAICRRLFQPITPINHR